MKLVNTNVELLAMTPEPLLLLERAGRICYKSEHKTECSDDHKVVAGECITCNERATRFVTNIIKRGHESVLEHASATFKIVTNRGVTHELVRHRVGVAFSQESTRYCNYGNDFNVLRATPIPDYYNCSVEPDAGNVAMDAMRDAEAHYNRLLEIGVAPQIARCILPIGIKTEIIMTANFRALRHMLNLRLYGTTGAPHPHIKDVFSYIKHLLDETSAAPVFADLGDTDA